MAKKILITGGGGFLGSHLSTLLVHQGYQVRILDNMNEQVHLPNEERPIHLDPSIEFIKGDLRDRETVKFALEGSDIVIHLAALEGIGQSMYRVLEYTDHNCIGTAVLLESILQKPIEKLVVASSMAIYGEGLYLDQNGKIYDNAERQLPDLKAGKWELTDSSGENLTPVATPEEKAVNPYSQYGLTKFTQEKMCLLTGKAYNIPVTSLRFSNIYGPKQPLFNPYSGVLALIAARLLNNNSPILFEDGFQLRDFIHINDATNACLLAVKSPSSANKVYNIGSGKSCTIREISMKLGMIMERNKVLPEITRKYRAGDVRHCFPDISLARNELGFCPVTDLDAGLFELAEWLKDQVVLDRVAEASLELSSRGLTV